MAQFKYSLDGEYTLKKALLWGNFTEHAKAVREAKNWKGRAAHLLIAAVEFLPIISQAASFTEWAVVKIFSDTPHDHQPPPLKGRVNKDSDSSLPVGPVAQEDKKSEGEISLPPKGKEEEIETSEAKRVDNEEKEIFDDTTGIYILSKGKLDQYGDKLWGVIEDKGVKKLTIEQDGKSFEYGPRVLKQFMKMKLPIEALTEEYSLIFEDDEELFETKGNLLLCGEYFQTLFGAGMEESKSQKIDLRNVALPFIEREEKMISLKQLDEKEIGSSEIQEIVLNKDILDDILQEVKTGNRDMEDDVYAIVCDNLQYSKWSPIPKGAFGPTQWEEHHGLKLDDVPDVPKNILARIEALEKEGKQEKEKLILIPKGVSLDSMEELAKNPKAGNSAKYDWYWPKIKEKYGKETVENSRWVLMSTEVLPESRLKTREEQLKMAREYEKGYGAPTLLEAVILNFTTHAATGKYLFGRGTPWTFTVCQEDPIQGWKLVVGGFAPAGLNVYILDDYDNVGVAPVLREF